MIRRLQGSVAPVACKSFLGFSLLAGLLIQGVGCSSPGGSAIRAPSVDPQDAAGRALELYDTDGDGLLSEKELNACPGLLSALKRYDADGDSRISLEELAAKLDRVFASGTGMVSVRCSVIFRGRPLRGAHVRYVPEKFLGESVLPAEGTTDDTGDARLMVPDELMPQDQRGLRTMQPGVYRIEITHPNAKLPAKYGGEESPLGHDVDPTVRGGSYSQFELSGK